MIDKCIVLDSYSHAVPQVFLDGSGCRVKQLLIHWIWVGGGIAGGTF